MTDQLHVLYVVSEWGAPTQTFVRREVDAALAAGARVTVLSLKAPKANGTECEAAVVHLGPWSIAASLLRSLLRHPWRSVGSLARAARGSSPSTLAPNLAAVAIGVAASSALPSVDWIHAHFAWVAASAADGVAAVRKQSFSVFPHAFDVFDERYIDRYLIHKLRRAAFVVVESPSIRDEVNRRYGCHASVARMGVPPELVLTDSSHRSPEPNQIVSVGSLLPKKGHDVLLRALSMLPDDTRLTIAGEGPERPALERLVRQLGIEDRVSLVGSLDEGHVVDLLDRAAVFALASRPTGDGDRDGVPNVLIEAMARAVPCVSTTVSGIPDLLGGGRGILVPPGDADALAHELGSLIERRGEAARLGEAGREHIAASYRTDLNWKALEARIRRHGQPDASRQTLHDDRRLDPRLTQHSYIQLRALEKAMREESADVPEEALLVDLGCGGKPYERLFACRYVGVDLLSTHGHPDCVAWAEHLPIRGAVADIAISTQQLEHVDDPPAVLNEAHRILRPDGTLLLSTHGVWAYHPDPHDYWRWTEEGLVRLIEQAGFAVVRVHRQGGLVAASLGLLLYPVAALSARVKPARAIAHPVLAVTNLLISALDPFVERVAPRHYASASYLVVARRRMMSDADQGGRRAGAAPRHQLDRAT